MIWLPEFGQEQLNVLCMAIFLAARKADLYRRDVGTKPIVDTAFRLYAAFDRRRERLEGLLGGGAVKAVLPRETLSHPSHIASLIEATVRKAGLTSVQVAQRVEGLRLLPNPAAFDAYIERVAKLAHSEYPVGQWDTLTRQALAAMATAGGDASFSAAA